MQKGKNMWLASALAIALALGLSGVSFGADDSSITGDTRTGIQSAMTHHIAGNLTDGKYVVYDAVTGELKKLTFERVHEGIVKKGDFYVSCADFIDEGGRKYDLDLLVSRKDGDFVILETVVHSIDGKKRPYHLED